MEVSHVAFVTRGSHCVEDVSVETLYIFIVIE